MNYGVAIVLLSTIVGLSSCKLRVKSSTPKTDVKDASENLLAYTAITTLSFQHRQQLPAWEVDARVKCGDEPPSPSRLDDLVYELIPESTRRLYGGKKKGDSSLCRHQGNEPDSMQLTRNLFADKALAIKVKYLKDYENSPPPMIRFNSGGAVHVSSDRFVHLFIGHCREFAIMNDIQFCKTTDPEDGRVIWVALVAPTTSPITPHHDGKSTVSKGVKQGDSGKEHVLPVASSGRIDMNITLPWVKGGFNLAVEVPNFNTELISYLQGSTDVGTQLEDVYVSKLFTAAGLAHVGVSEANRIKGSDEAEIILTFTALQEFQNPLFGVGKAMVAVSSLNPYKFSENPANFKVPKDLRADRQDFYTGNKFFNMQTKEKWAKYEKRTMKFRVKTHTQGSASFKLKMQFENDWKVFKDDAGNEIIIVVPK